MFSNTHNLDSLEKLIKASRTAHDYKNEPACEDVLIERCIELCLMAPNHKYTFPWKIYRVAKDGPRSKRSELADLALELKTQSACTDEQANRIRSKIMNPSELLVFTLERKDNEFEHREDYATISCSIQLLALCLRTVGLSYKWSSGGMTSHEQTYKTLSIDKSVEEIVAFIWVGQSTKELSMTKRPAISDVLVNL